MMQSQPRFRPIPRLFRRLLRPELLQAVHPLTLLAAIVSFTSMRQQSSASSGGNKGGNGGYPTWIGSLDGTPATSH